LQKNRLDRELKAKKTMSKEANRTVVISNDSATQQLYQKLNIKEKYKI